MKVLLEGDISRSHLTTCVKKIHPVVLLCPIVANKHASNNMRGEFRERGREILDKTTTSKDPRRKGEER